jgi:ABC-type multidrug transport system ATPase subunit
MSAASVLSARGLRAGLSGREILHGVDLQVREGDLYGLLGRNGAGKTTAMRCVLGFVPRTAGASEVFGTDSMRLHDLPQPIGVALDPPGLDDALSVRQNLELACIRGGLRGGRTVDEVLDLVRLDHRQHNRGDRLSHGQGRRAAVARALLGAPRLLVLDEPLAGLDPEGVEEMLALFVRLTREERVTIVLSSHHLREVEHVCTRVGLIEDGRAILEGETARLLAESGDGLWIACARPAAAAATLGRIAGVLPGVRTEADGVRIRVTPEFDAAGALAALVGATAGVTEFRRERASLVDVFRRALAACGGREEAA